MKHSVLRDIRLSAVHEGRLVLSDPSPFAILLMLPIMFIVFLKNGIVPQTIAGHQAVNGAAQAVSGIGTTFAFFIVGYTGLAFFRDHGWHTWERMQVSPLTTLGLIIGKVLPYLALGVVQVCALVAVGWLFLGMEVHGSRAAIVALVVLLCMSAVSLGLLLTAFAHSIQHLNATSSLSAVLLGGIGGAFAPTETFPTWAQAVAHMTPQFWAIEGFKQVIIGGASLRGVVPNLAALLFFTALFTTLAALRFDKAEKKQWYLD